MKFFKIAVLSIALLFASSQPGQSRDLAEIFTECGLGAMIASEIPPVAVITNIIWDLGTTATSSEMTTPDSCKGGERKTAVFIYDSYSNIEKDLASGKGEYLSTLTELAGCDKAVRTELSNALRNDFTTLVSRSDYSSQSRFEQAQNLHSLLSQTIDKKFSSSCKV